MIFVDYKKFDRSKDGKTYFNFLNWEQIVKIFMIDSNPPVCHNMSLLRKACILSKSTVIRDFEKNGDVMLYQYFNFSEFIEIIARVADMQSKNTMMEN